MGYGTRETGYEERKDDRLTSKEEQLASPPPSPSPPHDPTS